MVLLTSGSFAVPGFGQSASGSVEEGNGAVESGPAAASTRREALEKQRLQKSGELSPESVGRVHRFFIGFDQKGNETLADSSFHGFYPRLDFIARESSLSAGVRFWRPRAIGPADVLGSAFYSVNRYQFYDLQVGLIPNRGRRIPPSSMEEEDVDQLGDVDQARLSRFRLYGSFRYRDQTKTSYYGTGPDSKKEDKTNFRLKDSRFQITGGYQFLPGIAWTVSAGLLSNSLGPGLSGSSPPLSPPEGTVPGFDDPPSYLTLGSQVVADFRDDPYLPHSGVLVAFGWRRFDDVDRSDRYNFRLWEGEARAFLPLGSLQRVLAFRGYGAFANPTDFNEVPFFMLPSLGSSRGLRGYRSYRFRGEKLMRFQAEYRWEPSRRVELAVFGDTGTVANTGQQLSLSKLKSDFGVGVRIRTSRSGFIRIDHAWSNEGGRTFFRFENAF